jgi:hypothetical protein
MYVRLQFRTGSKLTLSEVKKTVLLKSSMYGSEKTINVRTVG